MSLLPGFASHRPTPPLREPEALQYSGRPLIGRVKFLPFDRTSPKQIEEACRERRIYRLTFSPPRSSHG